MLVPAFRFIRFLPFTYYNANDMKNFRSVEGEKSDAPEKSVGKRYDGREREREREMRGKTRKG